MPVPTPPWSVRISNHAQDLDADGHLPAAEVTYDNATSGLAADQVQAAIDELVAGGAGSGNVYTDETQAVQSVRYLMQDGTFRNPLLVGDGVLSVGAISTITDDTKYNAWPSICRMRGNRILLVYTKADSHHADNTGKAVGRIGVEGFGGAITWGAEFTIYDDPSDWLEVTGVAVLSTGRVIVSFYQNHVGSGNPLDGAWIVWSDDEGVSWQAPVLVNSTLSSYSYGSGRVLELPNGDLLQCVEGKNSGDTFSRMVVLRSTDQGATWGSQVTIATGTRDYYEGCLGLLDDDTVMVLLRTTDGSGDTYRSTSSDGGATWSAPALAFAGHGEPQWIQLSTGTLIAITRENDGSLQGDVWAYTSTDRGATWSSATTLDGTMYEMEYGGPVELLDGRVLVVYGYQPSSATTNSDIKQVYVSEGVTTFSGGVSLSSATPLVESGSGSAGTGTEASRDDHVHPAAGGGGMGRLLLSSDHATPIVFDDILQASDGHDLLYASE